MQKKFRLTLIVGSIFFIFPFRAETNGRVLLTIADTPVFVTEFNHYYRMAESGNIVSTEDFLTKFLYFKLKVFDARMHKWDTLPDFRLRCNLLQEKALEHYMTRNAHSNSDVPKKMQPHKSDKWLRMEHISLYLPQHAPEEEKRKAYLTIDSIYTALLSGTSFHDLSLKYNLPENNYQTGEWIPSVSLLDEFIEHIRSLKCGDFTKPFHSPLGLHIVKLVDTKIENTPAIEQMSLGNTNNRLNSDEISSILDQIEEEFLAVYWDERNFGNYIEVSDKELEAYFNAHKSDYTWDFPHFKGCVVHCLNKRAASRLKKKLKKIPLTLWNEKIKELAEEDKRLKAEVETGLFQIGKNEFVDKLAFKCGDYIPRADFPYTFVLGKHLEKAPEDYKDVLEDVKKDYILSCKSRKLQELKDEFMVEINQDVLKTVNCDGSK